jgi:hypothetical protein
MSPAIKAGVALLSVICSGVAALTAMLHPDNVVASASGAVWVLCLWAAYLAAE